jgi:hypothetical protein
MKDSRFYNLTKTEMVADLNDILSRFYGCSTRLTHQVTRLPKAAIREIHYAVYLWRNDPLAEQVKTLNEWAGCSL